MRRTIFHLFICLFAYWLIALFSAPAHAQAGQAPTGYNLGKALQSWVFGGDFANSMDEGLINNSPSGATTNNSWFNYGGYAILTGIAGCVPGRTCTERLRGTSYEREMNQQSALGGITTLTIAMYQNPAATTGLAIRDFGASLGFLPRSALAQGVGFSGLSPILPLWKGFRNIAYAILAILMIVIGFMVMFRKKIDPKTVVTVQNALPRIVITLILITFSYAIAGFMIDLMYLAIGLGSALFAQNLNNTAVSLFGQQADFYNGGFFTLLGAVFAPIINGSYDTIRNIPGNVISMIQNQTIGPGLLLLLAAPVAGAAGLALGVIVLVILSLAYLFGFIRIFFMLLSAYINIILSVLVGPIQILLDAFPGGSGFSSWIKNLFINLLPFPVTIFFLIIGNAFLQNLGTGQMWVPPFLPRIDSNTAVVGGLGLAGGATPTTGNFAIAILWLGLVLAIPSFINGIKESLKAKAALPSGAGAVLSPIGGAMGTVLTTGSQFYYGASFVHMIDEWRKGRKQKPGTEA